jgi:hypothetical protein
MVPATVNIANGGKRMSEDATHIVDVHPGFSAGADAPVTDRALHRRFSNTGR